MALEIVPTRSEHIPTLAGIAFVAFQQISEEHGFPPDFSNPDVATMALQMFATRPDIRGITAILDGRVVGSNFAQLSDAVAGIGPITVDPKCQAQGIGRVLMRTIVEWCKANHGPQIRLLQDTFNMRSLSLYTSLGFTVQEPIVLMAVPPAETADPTVRPIAPADLDACAALIEKQYKVSRRNELAVWLQYGSAAGIVPHLRTRDGRLVAVVAPGFLGFSVAETPEDLLATMAHTARIVPPPSQRLLIPVRHGELFRGALLRGWRSIKLLSLMSIGPYETPSGAWAPSIAY